MSIREEEAGAIAHLLGRALADARAAERVVATLPGSPAEQYTARILLTRAASMAAAAVDAATKYCARESD